MGAVKNYTIERAEILDTFSNCVNELKPMIGDNTITKITYDTGTRILKRLKDYTFKYDETIRMIQRSSNFLKNNLKTIKNSSSTKQEKASSIILIHDLFSAIIQTMDEEKKIITINYNSSQYYQEQIKKFEKKEADLNKKISELEPALTESKQQREELEKELTDVKQSMLQMRQEQEEQQRRQDAQTQQRTNIQDAFSALNAYSRPLETEKKRLNGLFYIYALLCIVTLVLLTIYEYRFLRHFNTLPNTNWTDYLPFYLPVPLCGGLLWAFICQMNRAQRQLVVLTDKLHHIKYIEGLLLAINTLSSDVSDAAVKIQQTIDTIIDNYLHHPHPLTETHLQQEASKDQIDLKQLTGFVREIKELTRK